MHTSSFAEFSITVSLGQCILTVEIPCYYTRDLARLKDWLLVAKGLNQLHLQLRRCKV